MKQKNLPALFQVEETLGPLEYKVMKAVWEKDKTTVREILLSFQNKRKLAYTTIMTVMDNLYKKGFLTREKVKKFYYYSPIAREDCVVTISLSKVFKDLIKEFGRGKVLYGVVNTSLPILSRITTIPVSSNEIIRTYKTPVGYSILFTLLLALLSFSAFDLLQNLSFFGSLDYLRLLTSEPFLFVNRLHLFILAFLESLPIVNILTTTISLILVVIFAKKLFKLLEFRMPSLTNLGGAI